MGDLSFMIVKILRAYVGYTHWSSLVALCRAAQAVNSASITTPKHHYIYKFSLLYVFSTHDLRMHTSRLNPR